MQPTAENADKWEAIIPDSEGNPYVYDVKKDVLEDMMNPRAVEAEPIEDGLGGWLIPEEKE